MRKNIGDRVKERSLLKSGNLKVELEDDEGVDNYDKAKSMPSDFSSFTLSQSKRLMHDVVRQKDGFYNNSVNYTDTDSLYLHQKYWSVIRV